VNFTDKNIPSVYAEGITLGNKIKKKAKKYNDVLFIPMKIPMEFIPSVKLLVNC